jgi:hypothetical protein
MQLIFGFKMAEIELLKFEKNGNIIVSLIFHLLAWHHHPRDCE